VTTEKARRRRRSFFIPKNTANALEPDRWAETPIAFGNTRWKKPIARHDTELYLSIALIKVTGYEVRP
jgi:hypothetical protein